MTKERITSLATHLALVVALAALAFGFQGRRGIFAPDEGYYVGTAQSMLQTGDYLVPRLGSQPWLDKPPLSLWGVAAGLALLGQSELGARAFHGLCYLLTTLLIYALGRAWGGSQYGLRAGVTYALMLLPFVAASVVTPDTPLTLLTTAAFFCFWNSLQTGGGRAVVWKTMMGAAFGLAFLTKGPAALVPAAALFVFLVLRRKAREYCLTPRVLPGLVLFCLVGLGWYAFVAREFPGAMAYFVKSEVLGRTISPEFNRNAGLAGVLIYLPVLLVGTLPGSVAWWPALWRVRSGILDRVGWKSWLADPVRLLLALWIAGPMVILVLARSRLPLYALPIFPALALATARLTHFRDGSGPPPAHSAGRTARNVVLVGVWMVALLGLRVAAAHVPSDKDMRALYASMKEYLPADEEYETVAVRDHLEGLSFYDRSPVEQVTTRTVPYPFFVPAEDLKEKIAEIATSANRHVLICREDSCARLLRESLRAAGVACEEAHLSSRYHLFACESPETDRPVRLAVLGDLEEGEGISRRSTVSSVMRLLYVDKSLRDGVIMLGDNLFLESEDPGTPAQAARMQFERPFADLLRDHVPFYAALGDHERDPALRAFELSYEPFRMNGAPYYTTIFGNGLVQLFMLDSTTLMQPAADPDPDQVDWLERSLAASRATWKIVALHHPIRSTSRGGLADPDLAVLLEPILIRYGVALVLQGHDHLYERSRRVRGIVYITSGSAARVRRDGLRPDEPKRRAGYDRTQVVVFLEFDPRACRITAYNSLMQAVDNLTLTHPGEASAPQVAGSR